MAGSPGKITDRIAMLGEGGVGKTSLTINLTMHHFTETYDPTLEDSYRRQCVIDGVPSHLEILDTAGQEDYAALREQWIRQNELFVIVYDVTRRSSFEATEALFHEVVEVKRKLESGGTSSSHLSKTSSSRHNNSQGGHDGADSGPFGPSLVILVGNKSDLDTRRRVGTVEGQQLAKRLGCGFTETSAKLGTNVEQAFFSIVRADRQRKAQRLELAERERSDELAALGIKPPRPGRGRFFSRLGSLLHRN